MKRDSKGFTLVELIIVIAVIGVLAAILIPVFSNVIKKANAKSALADARNAVSAYVTESMERRTQGDTSCPDLITLIVQKGGRYYLFGYDTAHSNSILVSNANEEGLEASSINDLITNHSWNSIHAGSNYNPADQTDYDGEADGYFYLVQRDGTTGEMVNGQNFRGIVGADPYYLRLDTVDGDYGLNLNVGGDTEIYQGCLIKGTYEGVLLSGDATSSDGGTTSLTHTITYDLNLPSGVTALIGNATTGTEVQTSYTVNHNADHIVQGTPFASNDDYVFAGWYEGTDEVAAVISHVTADHALHAEWTTLTYVTITLETEYEDTINGGTKNISFTGDTGFTGTPLTMSVRQDRSFNNIVNPLEALIDDASIVTGMYWQAWQIQIGSTTFAYTSSDIRVVGTEDITIRPVVGPTQYQIHFKDANNQEVENPVRTKQYGQSVGTFPEAPSVSGRVFLGWTYDLDGEDYMSYVNPVTRDMTFTAHYGYYSVTFYDVDGTELSTSQNENTYTVPAYNLSTGHHFTGWTVSGAGSFNGAETEFTATANNVTVTATEAINVITVKYTDGHTTGYDAGTAGVISTQNINYGDDAVQPADLADYDSNHQFSGWSRTNTNITGNHGETLLIHATWGEVVTITYDLGAIQSAVTAGTVTVERSNGSAFQSSYTFSRGQDHLVQLGLVTATNTTGHDWVFNGWFDGSDEVTGGTLSAVQADKTLTAHWTELAYVTITLETGYTDTTHGSAAANISFTGDTGFTGTPLTKTARQDASLNGIIDPLEALINDASIAEGMYFQGWLVKVGSSAGAAYTGAPTLVGTENITITPIIGPLTYTITFKDGANTIKQTTDAIWGSSVVFPSNEDVAAMQALHSNHFKGWQWDDRIWASYTPVASNMTFEATWGDYVVTFYDVNGTALDPQPSHTGDVYNVPAANTLTPNTGYHITGWTVSNGGANSTCTGSTYTALNDGVSITATEAINVINVVYTDGFTTGYTAGTAGVVATIQVNYGGHVASGDIPASSSIVGTPGENYTFSAWSEDGTAITVEGAHNSTHVIYALWNDPVEITYNANVASGASIPQTTNDQPFQATYYISKGGTHTVQHALKAYTYNNVYYVFDGWYNDATSTEVSGDITEIQSDMSFTAQWQSMAVVTLTLETQYEDLEHNTQNVTYSAADGFSGTPLTKQVHQGDILNTIVDALVVNPASIAANMEFKGWEIKIGTGSYAGYNSGTQVTIGTANISIKPIIGPLKFTVEFINGSTTVQTQQLDWGASVTFPANPSDNGAGQHFIGWQLNGSGDPMYSYPNTVTGAMTFRAQFAPYTVTFYNPNGTTISTTIASGDTYNVPTPTLTSASYQHYGWVVANGGANNTLALGASTYTAVQNGVSITAQEYEMVTVTFNANGGSSVAPGSFNWNITSTPVTFAGSWTGNGGKVPKGIDIHTLLAGSTASGSQTFKGWATTSGATTWIDSTQAYAINTDTTFYAVYQASGYTITYTSSYGDPYVISGVADGTVHNVLTMEEAELKIGNSKTGVLYWECSNGTNYSPAGNYVASAGSSPAAAASLANSVEVHSNLTFTAHTITTAGTSDNTELFTFTFTPANGAGGTRTFVTGYKYRAASAGHTFVDPSAYGFTAPTGKMFDHWEMTYRDYGDTINPHPTFAVGATYNTQRDMFFIPVYADAPGLTITFTDGASGVYNVTNNNGNSLDGTIYFVGDDGEEFILPSIAECGFTAPSGKMLDKWVLTSGDADPAEGVAGESGIVNTENSVYEAQWKDAPANVTYTVRIYDTWMGTTTNVGTAQAPAVNPTWADVKGSVSGLPQYWYTADSATPATTSGTTITFNGSQYVTTNAADDQYSPLPTYTAYTGTGKQFQCITSLASLNKINTSTANLSKNYYLMTDITDTSNNFTPICKVSGEFYDFSGVFDGGNHAINIKAYYDAKNYVGIFGQTSGVVKNISNTISKASQIGGSQYVGGIVGYVGSTGKVLNCYVYTTVQQGMIAGDSFIGGICGYNDGLVQYCRCNTTKTVAIKGDYSGSICGQNEGTISRCTGYSDPCGWANGECVGGIVGCLEGSNAIVEECAYTGRVCYGQNYSTVYGTGGIVGASNEGSTFYIKNSYYYNTSSGMICGKNAVGGIQGHCEGNLHWWYVYACLPGVDSANSQAGIDAGYFIPDSYDFKQSYSVTSFSQLSSKDKSQWDTTNIWTLSGTPYTLKRARYS